MPAINVARTDTFEIQRVKINQIGDQIFNVTAGGSDLSTGNLKLGDGTRVSPSLSFVSDPSLGIYKPDLNTIGIVSSEKKISDISASEIVFYKSFNFRQKTLTSQGIVISNSGQNYDAGTYVEIPVVGGTGDGGLFDVTIVDYSGTITNVGANYNSGQYTGISLTGGSGTGASCNFEVPALDGTITNAGSAYAPGSYTNVPLTGGSGTGAEATISITGTTTLPGTVTTPGSGYVDADYFSVEVYNVPRQTFVLTTTTNVSPPPNSIYVVDGITQDTLTLEIGNTYRFDVSDISMDTHPFYFHDTANPAALLALPADQYVVVNVGIEGTAGAFVDLIILPNASPRTIGYDCSAHQGMGGTINVVSGTIGVYGRGAFADISVSGGAVSNFTFSTSGEGYKQGDQVSTTANLLGGTGSGLIFTIGTPVYSGVVDGVTVTDQGQNYQAADILSANDSDLGNGGGSGFQFSVAETPGIIIDFEFAQYGSNYVVGDTLSLPTGVSNQSVYIPGTLNGVSSTVSTASAQISVPDSSRLQVFMSVFTEAGSVGSIDQGVQIASIDSPTLITLSSNPTGDGAVTLTFVPLDPTIVDVPSVVGISVGDFVEKVSGDGILADATTVSFIDDVNNQIRLSSNSTEPGQTVINFNPAFGVGTTPFAYEIQKLGSISDVVISAEGSGNGYSENDVLSVSPTDLVQPLIKTVLFKFIQTVTFSPTVPASTFTVGDNVRDIDGAVVTIVPTGTDVLASANQSYTAVSASGGTGSGATFDVTRDANGTPATLINSGGFGYSEQDTLTILGTDVGGASPADDISITVDSITTTTGYSILQVNESGGNTTNIVIQTDEVNVGFESSDIILSDATGATNYTVDTVTDDRIFLIDGQFTPNLTLYVGSTYRFDLSDGSLADHPFSLSIFEGGKWSPSRVENVVTTLSTTNKQITVASTTNILEGMEVTANGVGAVATNTFVESIDSSTQITLTEFPFSDGSTTLTFFGAEYTDSVTREADSLEIKVTDTTPNLYYYCNSEDSSHAGEGGTALITIDPNNPKIFGSGFSVVVNEVNTVDIISGSIADGQLTTEDLISNTFTLSSGTVSGTLNASDINGATAKLANINADTSLTVTSPSIVHNGNYFIGATPSNNIFSVELSTGNVSANGLIKTLDHFNSNDQLKIEDNVISSFSGFDINLTPSTGRIAKVDTTSALVIPAGDTSSRPAPGIVQDGSIRFNTETSQYEGYSSSTSSWSSLGGVRDLDGNTTILAELTVGANDNTLWFYNDNINTIRVTPNYLEFANVKKIRSLNMSVPSFTEWAANTPVSSGEYLKHRNNLFEVTISGTTGTPGSAPTDTSGTPFTNGSATLVWSSFAVDSLDFEDITEVRIAPLGGTDLSINNELRLSGNVISTDIGDLLLRPNSGKKVVIDAASSLVIPNGTTPDRGVAEQGSIRFNTTTFTYEGYDGANWGSLGGVKDVDQNTYIIPELSPGSNENILYFFNDNNNTLQLTTTALDFLTVDTIRSQISGEFEITAGLMTFNNAETTLDNTDVSRTFIHTSKQYLDLGLSSGISIDPVLRLDDQGDVYLNTTFGTGTFTGVKVLDGELKEFELADVKILTERISLVKGTSNNGNSILYNTTTQKGCKTTVVAENNATGEKEFIEFGIIDNGVDVFHTEYGNIRTGDQLIIPTFEVTPQNEVRINIQLGADIGNTETIDITFVSNITKK